MSASKHATPSKESIDVMNIEESKRSSLNDEESRRMLVSV